MCAPTDVVFIDGCQSGGAIDRSSRLFLPWDALDWAFVCGGVEISPEDIKERHDRTFKRPEPVKGKPILISRKAENRYYQLTSGDIIDLNTKTILYREGLLKLMQ